MGLPASLVSEFAKATYDKNEVKSVSTAYATAVIGNNETGVRLDGSDIVTPAVFAVKAHNGDRVLVSIQNRTVLVTNNITTPSITTGILEANVGIIVHGYLTTNEERVSYNDQNHNGLTFSQGGIGAHGLSGYWYVTNDGSLYGSNVEVSGKITATSGSIKGDLVSTGINASNITTGIFSVKKNGTTTFSANANTGEVIIVADSFSLSNGDTIQSIANSSASSAINTYDSGLDQTKVYNKLTNNGQTQGIYLSNGKLYINASYINTGIFSVKKNGTTTFSANANTGEVKIIADTFSLSNGDTIQSIASSAINTYDNGLDQAKVLNRLTNGGQSQGIYLENGNLYIHASYLKSGTISANCIGANTITVDKLKGAISDTGNTWTIDLTNGTMTIGEISAAKITSGSISADRIAANSITSAKIAEIGSFTINSYQMGYEDSGTPATKYTVFVRGKNPNGTAATSTTPHFGVYYQELENGSYGDYKRVFAVYHDGTLRAEKAYITGTITASSGNIGGYVISTSANQGTTANGGHVFAKSLYVHTSGSETSGGTTTNYEYESGLASNNAANTTAFYVRRIQSGAAWSSAESVFYVLNNGYLRATKGQINGDLVATGINASNITTGIFSVKKGNTITFLANANTGEVKIVADTFSMSNGSTIDSIAQSKISIYDSALNQTAVVNKLNRNGLARGITLYDGQLYISADYINTGTLSADHIAANSITSAKLADVGGWAINSYQISKSSAINESSSSPQTQYQAFMRSVNSGASSTTGSTYAFGAMQRTYENSAYGAWESNFYVRYDGYLYSRKGNIAGWGINEYQLGRYTEVDESSSAEQTQYHAFVRAKNTDGTAPTGSTGAFAILKRTYKNSAYSNWTTNFVVRYNGTAYISTQLDIAATTAQTGKLFVGKGDYSEGCYISYNLNSNETVFNASAGDAGNLSILANKVVINGQGDSGAMIRSGTISGYHSLLVKHTVTTIGNDYYKVTIGDINSGTGVSSYGVKLQGNDSLITVGNSVIPSTYVNVGVDSSNGILLTGETAILGHLVASKSISVQSTSASAYAFKLINSVVEGQFRIGGDGAIGLYDDTRSSWILYKEGIAAFSPKLIILEDTSISGKVNATGNYTRQNNNYTRGTAPSSAVYSSLVFTDKNAAEIGYLQAVVWTNGNHALRLCIQTPTAAGGNTAALVLEKNSSGTITCSIAGTTTINNGNLNLVTTGETSRAIGVENSAGKVQLYMASNGNMGVYDATNSKYIIYRNPSGQTYLSFVASDEASTSAANLFIGSTGRIQKSNGSSRRYKIDIAPIADWKKVLDIPVVSFKYKDDYLSKDDQRYDVTVPGFIAEDVDSYYPVAADKRGDLVEDWNMRYIIPPMLAVEQDHEKRIKELEDELARLKAMA